MKAKGFKCELVKAKDFADLAFKSTLGRSGYWEQQINLLRGDPDSLLKIRADDASSLTQLRTKSKKLKVSLLFARQGDFIFVRAYLPSEAQSRLVLLLREPRSINDLRAKSLQLNLEAELQSMVAKGHAEYKNEKWKLTERGLEELAA